MNTLNLCIKKVHRTILNSIISGTVILLISSINLSYAQYNLSIGINYVSAFGESAIELQNTTYILNPTRGYEITANNSYHFPNTKIKGVLEIGFRQLYFSGNSTNLTYKGQSSRIIGALGASYLFTSKFHSTAYVEAENNLELADFYSGAGDLFRISLSIESTYALTENLGVTALFSRAMTPITAAYTFTNPQYEFRLGLVYQLTK